MADLPELTVESDLAALLRGRVHLKQLTVDLKQFTVSKDGKGRLNLDSLSFVQKAKGREKPGKGGKVDLQIDQFHLKVGRVSYRDFSRGVPPAVQEFQVDLDERYTGIRDPSVLGALIVSRALFKTTIARLTQFDLGSLEGMLGSLNQVKDKALEVIGGTVGGTLDSLRKVLE